MVKDPLIRDHFRRHDPILFTLFDTVTLETLPARHPNEFFVSLCREIIGQQLSGRVADVIYERFIRLFPRRRASARAVLAVGDDALRETGMSWSKVRFIRDLATKAHAKEIDLSALTRLPDQEVIAYLTKIKGVGPWTAEMFLIFTLGRADVFSYGDLGLRRAIQTLYKFRREPSRAKMEKIVRKWKPYRTYGARVLWGYLDAPPLPAK